MYAPEEIIFIAKSSLFSNRKGTKNKTINTSNRISNKKEFLLFMIVDAFGILSIK